jgi:hypothetical protein
MLRSRGMNNIKKEKTRKRNDEKGRDKKVVTI